jgi:hypothetical protein
MGGDFQCCVKFFDPKNDLSFQIAFDFACIGTYLSQIFKCKKNHFQSDIVLGMQNIIL